MKTTIIIILIVALLVVGCNSGENEDMLEEISMRLPIPIVETSFAPYYLAQDKGYYAKEGLELLLEPGSPETNPIKMVSSGVDEFGIIGGIETLLVARSKGLPVVAIATLHKNSNFPVLLTLPESGLETIQDLQNKKIGFFYGHISTDVLRHLLHKENISYEEVNVGFDYNQLITGNIDAQWAFRTTAGLNLPAKGIAVHQISPADYGIQTHGHTIFTTEDVIRERPELVRAFLRATVKGIQETVEEPTPALTATLARDSSLDPILERERLQLYNEVTSNSELYPAGYMDASMFEEAYERLDEEGLIEQPFDVHETFTTQFLEEIYG